MRAKNGNTSVIAETSVIYPNVTIGAGARIEEFCIIGIPPRSVAENEPTRVETIIGDNALIRCGTVIYAGNRIGNNFQTGNKTNIREHNVIGSNVSIGTLAVIEHHVTIEDNVRIHSQAFIPEYSLLKEYAWVGPNAVFTNVKFPLTGGEVRGPILEKRARIGANATIMPEITIGENALVGAGSVVVHDVEKNTIVAGNPARKIRTLDP